MAEAFYNHLTHFVDSWSAGVQKDTPERYGVAAPQIVQIMREVGIDVSRAKVKTISPKMVKESENIIIMCKKEECPRFVLNAQNITFWDIEDPFEMSLDAARKVRNEINEKILFLV